MCLKLKIEHQNRVVIKQDLCKFPMYLYLRWRQFLSVFNLLTFHFFLIPSCIFDSLYKMSLRKEISFETLCSQSNYSYLESRDYFPSFAALRHVRLSTLALAPCDDDTSICY